MFKIFYHFCKYQGPEVNRCVINNKYRCQSCWFYIYSQGLHYWDQTFPSPHKFDIFQQQLTFLCKSLTFKVWHWELIVCTKILTCKAFFWLKDFLHMRQAKGLSPVWTLMCLTNCDGFKNFLSQMLQDFCLLVFRVSACTPTSSFTSIPWVVSRWSFRSFSDRNTESHQGQI